MKQRVLVPLNTGIPRLAVLGLGLVGVVGCDRFDHGDGAHWDELSGLEPGPPFELAMIADLPEPAQRFLAWSIAEGTPLARSVGLEMEGTIVLDPERGSIPIEAEQVLAPPEGFIWSAGTTGGWMRIRGFDRFVDGRGEMRWKLFGLIPVMTATGSDVTRSAAARLLMESVMVPSALVPRADLDRFRWEAVDAEHALFEATVAGETVRTTLQVAEDGRPVRAWADRWNEGQYERFQVELSGEHRVGGYRLPRHVRAGWRPGEPDELWFFDAELTRASFPGNSDASRGDNSSPPHATEPGSRSSDSKEGR